MVVKDRMLTAAQSELIGECDICIVGTGPAGSTLARELSHSGQRVTVLESGGLERDDATDGLNEVENVGRARVLDQWEVRNRILGGSSHTWGGRCAPFDAIDFEHRPWVPMSGWPFQRDEIGQYLARSAAHLGLNLGDGFSDERFWTLAGRDAPAVNPDPRALLPFFWQFSRDGGSRLEAMRFGKHLAREIGPNVRLITGATVLRVNVSEAGDRVVSLDYASPAGAVHTLRTARVILCAGGIENARLLLASNAVLSDGLGNRLDLVGRYLMDHPRGPVGRFDLAASAGLQRRFGRFNVRGNLFRGGFRLSPVVQRAEGLLNCAVWLGEAVAEDDPWEVLKRWMRRQPDLRSDFAKLLANRHMFLSGIGDLVEGKRGVVRKLSALHLDCMVEQRPDPDSRVTLSDRRDRFGVPLARIDWRVHRDEARTMRRTAELIADQFARGGLPAPILEPWVVAGDELPVTFLDVAHPTGTTRMATEPSSGVVDPECRVYGISGLYIAGSSVFPTAGHCNPTQLIVALAIRLGDHLKNDVDRRPAVEGTPTSRQRGKGGTVLVTGGTGLIGRHVVADLVERGYQVRATTSRTELPAETAGGAIEWVHFDLHGTTEYDELMRGCQAVLHIGAEMKDHARMTRTNVEGTRLLATAAEAAGVAAFCYTSSISVYGSGLTRQAREDSPVLTADRDVPSEYWGDEGIRIYGRTKLGGELALREVAKTVRYTILRPTVVVGVDEILKVGDWPLAKRIAAAHRHSHFVYVRDVSQAIIWAMERSLLGARDAGSVEVFNVGEDEHERPTHADFMRRAYRISGARRFKVVPTPWFVDWTRDLIRLRRATRRHPLWSMRFPADRLYAAGYTHRYGMSYAYDLALKQLQRAVDP